MKISKSTIINLNQVNSVKPSFNGMISLLLKNSCKDYISRKYIPSFKKYLGLWKEYFHMKRIIVKTLFGIAWGFSILIIIQTIGLFMNHDFFNTVYAGNHLKYVLCSAITSVGFVLSFLVCFSVCAYKWILKFTGIRCSPALSELLGG